MWKEPSTKGKNQLVWRGRSESQEDGGVLYKCLNESTSHSPVRIERVP